MIRCRKLVRFSFLALLAGGQITPASLFAQSITCPSAVLQQEERPEIKVVVDQVGFQGDNPLSEPQRADLVKEIQQHSYTLNSGDPEDIWFSEVVEVTVRNALQDNGYFRASPNGQPYLIRASGNELHYAVRIELFSGPQFRLGDVRFVSTDDTALAFAENALREQLELKNGDLFNASKIRLAMDRILKLYGAKGFIDMVSEPVISINEKDSRIDVTLKIDEGIAYRISRVDLLGSATAASPQLSLPQSAGQLVNPQLWWKFFEDNESQFPAGATFQSSVMMERNTRDRTVRIAVDFHACPVIESPQGPRPILRTKSGP